MFIVPNVIRVFLCSRPYFVLPVVWQYSPPFFSLPLAVLLSGIPETLVALWGALCGSVREILLAFTPYTLHFTPQLAACLYPLHFTLSTIKNRPSSHFYLVMSKNCCIFAPAIPRRGCLRVIGWGGRHI